MHATTVIPTDIATTPIYTKLYLHAQPAMYTNDVLNVEILMTVGFTPKSSNSAIACTLVTALFEYLMLVVL